MPEMIVWRVKRAFKYAGHWLKAGDVWEPAGHRNDAAIKRSGQVRQEHAPGAIEPQTVAPELEAARSRQRAKKVVDAAEPRPQAGTPT